MSDRPQNCDVLAINAHPDDAEITAGGTLIQWRNQKGDIVLADLSHGEAGTRGDGSIRDQEAAAAAKFLGARRVTLDFQDSYLNETPGLTEAIISLIRDFRPHILLAPFTKDLHPDHAVVGQAAAEAFFLAGVKKRSPKTAPFRPEKVYHYMSHHRFEPSFVVDVSSVWEEKLKLIRCYASQLHPADSSDRGAHLPQLTNILERVEIRDRYFGHYARVRYAEPFFVEGPVLLDRPPGLP